MKTLCPECQTTFRVTPDQLKARAGKVRCGQCQTVFNALDSLIEETVSIVQDAAPTSAPAPGAAPAPTPDSIPAPEAAPASAPQSETDISPAENQTTKQAPDSALSVLLEPPGHSDTTIVAPRAPTARIEPAELPDDALSETEAQELGKATGLILPREMTEVPGYSKWSAGVMAAPVHQAPDKPMRWPYVLVATLLSFALLGQIVFRFRGELAVNLPVLQPALQSLSSALGSSLPLQRRVELVSIESSDLQNDVARGNLLVLSATVRNRAGFPQAFPALELALTDTQDTPIARKVFLPDEYLPASQPQGQGFAAHSDIGVHLWIEAKDISAAGYRLYVFYP